MPRIDRLVWNDENSIHIAIHFVTRQEVEEVCQTDPLFVFGHSGRLMAIGKTSVGRAIAVILDPEAIKGEWYVVTARSADRKERALYVKMKGEPI